MRASNYLALGLIMIGEYLYYGLLAALAIALFFAAFTDIKRRQIDNWLTAAIALGAPAFWWASGMALWPDVAIQLGMTLLVFVVLAVLFAINWMGGGDVKLLTALALWIAPSQYLQLLIVMALIGGVLTLVLGVYHIMKRQRDRLAVPYGIAISAAGLWTIYSYYLPDSAQAFVLG